MVGMVDGGFFLFVYFIDEKPPKWNIPTHMKMEEKNGCVY
jgi:hypothetical protein